MTAVPRSMRGSDALNPNPARSVEELIAAGVIIREEVESDRDIDD